MSLRSTIVRRIGVALVGLLLCAIFASELPELLSLTDNTSNDYAVRSADSLVSPVLDTARRVHKPTIEFCISVRAPLPGNLGTLEETELTPAHLFILYSILRR